MAKYDWDSPKFTTHAVVQTPRRPYNEVALAAVRDELAKRQRDVLAAIEKAEAHKRPGGWGLWEGAAYKLHCLEHYGANAALDHGAVWAEQPTGRWAELHADAIRAALAPFEGIAPVLAERKAAESTRAKAEMAENRRALEAKRAAEEEKFQRRRDAQMRQPAREITGEVIYRDRSFGVMSAGRYHYCDELSHADQGRSVTLLIKAGQPARLIKRALA